MITPPYREAGYSIERDTLTIHERYQDHAPQAMRTSALGIYNLTRGGGQLCAVCFPAPPEPKRPRMPKVEPAYVEVPQVEATVEEETRRTEADET